MKNIFKSLLLILGLSVITSQLPAATVAVIPAASVPVGAELTESPDVDELVKSFKKLSRTEKKSRLKEVKKAIKEYRQQKKAGADPSTNTLLIIIVTILIPPLGVFLYEGSITSRFWISLLLTLLFYVPGLIYSLLVVTDSI